MLLAAGGAPAIGAASSASASASRARPVAAAPRFAAAPSPRQPSPAPLRPAAGRPGDVSTNAGHRGRGTGGRGYSGGGGGGYGAPSVPVADRLVAAVPWLLPLLDAFSYGRFLFYQYPLAARAVSPLAPLVSLYASVPFAPLVCFFGLYLGVVSNAKVSRFARFSAMQAVLVDILLVLPRLLESLASPPAQGWGLKAYITAQNSIWLLVAGVVAFGVVSALLGRSARIPFVAEAADAQIMR